MVYDRRMHGPYPLFILLVITLGLFIWGRFRYDVVALLALMAAAVLGIVPVQDVFSGFGNIAVVTVAAVMIISRVINESGVVNFVVMRLARITDSFVLQLAILCLLIAVLSAFMNNVGALALMMPITIQTALNSNRSPALYLMPLAIASALGGLCTAIGTPPNLIISAYRDQILGQPFSMFDFAPVGVPVTLIGIAFLVLIGYRLLPARRASKQMVDRYQINDYITEVKLTERSVAVGKTRREFENLIKGDLTVVALERKGRRTFKIPANKKLHEGDVLIIEASHADLDQILQVAKIELLQDVQISSEQLISKNVGLTEAVVPPNSRLEGRSWQRLRLRSRYGLNLLAIAREAQPFKERLHHLPLKTGDVLLVQGETDNLREKVVGLGLLPLVERGVKVGLQTSALLPALIFLVAIVLTGFGILPVQIAFASAVVVMLLLRILPVRAMYESVDWSVIFLLAGLIPLGNALQTTGGTQLIINAVLHVSHSPAIILVLLMAVTILLTSLLNNAATAVIMAPIAASTALNLHVNVDTFLMGVVIAASCSFLTPIGHQNNTLVMSPGGYRFADYWRVGLPLEILIMLVAVPLLLLIWPL